METGTSGVSFINHYMEANQIKDAHILDILFEGRNKEYGAYELRKTYNKRVLKSLVVTSSVVGLLFLCSRVAGFGNGRHVKPLQVGAEVELQQVKEPETKQIVIPPPVVHVQVAMVRITTPRILPDNLVKPNERPPENDEADTKRIGLANQTGVDDPGIAGPPQPDGGAAGVVEKPKLSDDDGIFRKVEIDASFPGGLQQWARFLNRNLRVPDDAVNNGIQGEVMVQFVVDVDGSVSDVQAISGPEQGGLREEAVRVIRKSGKWIPAIQNGRSVKAYRRQPIIFKIAE